MSEVVLPGKGGSGDSGCFLCQLDLQGQKVNHQECLGQGIFS